MNLKVTIQGLDKFADGIKRAPQLTVNELSKAVYKSIGTINTNAVKEAPANKQIGQGARLKQQIKFRMISKLAGVVEAFSPYAIFVHEGTRPHTIVPVYKKVLANKRTGEIFGKLVHHPGTKPNPFMERAIKNSAKKIEEFFSTALQNVLKAI